MKVTALCLGCGATLVGTGHGVQDGERCVSCHGRWITGELAAQVHDLVQRQRTDARKKAVAFCRASLPLATVVNGEGK